MSKRYLFLSLAIGAMLAVIFLLPEAGNLKHQAKVTLGVGAFAIIVWITQALDDAQSGFCIVGFLALFGGAKLGQALSGYATGGVWIVTLGMIMAAGMERSGLSRRMALRVVSLAGASPSRLYWMVAVITLIMSFFIPSLGAKTLLLLPIIAQMGTAIGAEKGQSSMIKALVFIVIMTGTIFCVAILTSHAANPITATMLEQATGSMISWGQWFVIGAPPALVCGFLSVLILLWIYPPDIADISAGQAHVSSELKKMGPMSAIECYTLVVFLLTVLLWATDWYHKLNSTLVTLFTVIALIAPGPQQVMTWKEAQSKVPWNIFIVYGAGLSLGGVLVSSGAAKWLAETFFYGFAGMDLRLQVVIFIWLMQALQVLFTGSGPKTTALTPVLIAYAMATGISTTPFVLLVGMNMLHQYLLPITNMPNILALATEEITVNELMKTGAVLSLFVAVFMSVMVYTYWTWIGMFN